MEIKENIKTFSFTKKKVKSQDSSLQQKQSDIWSYQQILKVV